MIIKKRRIRRLDPYVASVPQGQAIIFGVRTESIPAGTLTRVGLAAKPSVGDMVLPSPDFGPISRYNALGKEIVHKDQPMETAYRQIEWHWQEWRGPYEREERSEIVDVPYPRYPRTFIPPPGVELAVGRTASGQKVLVSPSFLLGGGTTETMIHTVNLFLEIFGECEVFSENLEELVSSPVRRLNWVILPPGKRPWEQLRTEVDQILSRVSQGKRVVIEYRLETVNSYGPEFLAIGRAGFRGYVIFGFPARNTYVLESIYFGNATYVFAEQWEELSQKTKAEILSASLQEDRIIHRVGWQKRVHDLLTK